MRMRKLAMLAVLAVLLLSLGAGSAGACSCVPLDPRSALADADAAFVGVLLEKLPAPPETVDDPSYRIWMPRLYRFRVEEAVKGSFGPTVDVISSADGASCGIEKPIGARTGLLLKRAFDGTWRSSLCQQIDPGALRLGTTPLPRPTGRGAIALLVGGRFGSVRTLALDAAGRTIAYGTGEGSTYDVSVCPGSRRTVELVTAHDGTSYWTVVAVRDLTTMRVESETRLPAGRLPQVALCRGTRAETVFLGERHDWNRPKVRVLRLDNRGLTTLYDGPGVALEFARGRALVLHAPARGSLTAVQLDSGQRSLMVSGLPARLEALSLSPDGKRLVGVSSSHVDASLGRLFLVDFPGGRARVKSRLLDWPTDDFGQIVWLSTTRFGRFSPGQHLAVYGIDLKRRAYISLRSHRIAVARNTVYGIGTANRSPVLVSARLPTGRPRTVRTLPSPLLYTVVPVPAGPAVVPFQSCPRG